MELTQMDMADEPAVNRTKPVRLDNYQPSFDTTIVQSSGWGLSVVSAFFRHVLQLALVGMLAYGSYWVVSNYILQSVEVTGASMSPTLGNSQHYLLDRWTYLIREPQKNDIVVIRDPEDNLYSVKRIIAAEGDFVQFKHGKVFLNGRELDEPYLAPGTLSYCPETRSGDKQVVCGKGRYFLMGDNRNNSIDSRVYGPVAREKIMGMVIR